MRSRVSPVSLVRAMRDSMRQATLDFASVPGETPLRNKVDILVLSLTLLMSRAQHYFRVLIESALPVLATNFNVLLSDKCAAHPPRLTPFPAPNLNILHLPKHYQVRSSPCRVHSLEIIFDLIHDILIRVVLYIIKQNCLCPKHVG